MSLTDGRGRRAGLFVGNGLAGVAFGATLLKNDADGSRVVGLFVKDLSELLVVLDLDLILGDIVVGGNEAVGGVVEMEDEDGFGPRRKEDVAFTGTQGRFAKGFANKVKVWLVGNDDER